MAEALDGRNEVAYLFRVRSRNGTVGEMRFMLTAKQHELLLYIQRKLEETGISPSFEEMKEALDLKSKSGVHRLISALEERGFIRRLPNRARALEVTRQPENVNAAARPAPANDTVVQLSPPRSRPEPANDIIEL